LQVITISVALLSIFVFASGCRKQTVAKPLPIEEVPSTIKEAFKQSSNPEVTNAVSEVFTIGQEDHGKTLEELQVLTEQPNLTPEQRRATDRAVYSVLDKLRQSASKGDKAAEEALKKYRATK
jgi:hypothetical protein